MAMRQKPVKSLLTCPVCKLELRLFGIESETAARDLYAFECAKCGRLEGSVRVNIASSWHS